jgi:hypothetical protein
MLICSRLTKIIVVLVAGIFLQVSQAQAITQTECGTKDVKKIKIVVAKYLQQHTAVSPQKVNIASQQCISGYALVKTIPSDSSTDPAFVYLHKINGLWQVMALGTYFDEAFLQQMPVALRDLS